ncbi:MAG: hypothetical protein EZS28_034015, partial [Streblomastix strix]
MYPATNLVLVDSSKQRSDRR